jgi:hypothetical protein
LVPVTVTLFPVRPWFGVKLVTVGGTNTVKLVALVAVPAAVVTVMGPVVAPVGTVAMRLVAVAAVKLAVTPLNFTVLLAGTGSKFVPVIVTEVPTGPSVGVNVVIVGACCVTKVASNWALRLVASKYSRKPTALLCPGHFVSSGLVPIRVESFTES